ncbi:MAG: hypothetical protein II190_06035, partial [Ruminococcus sp.]|nr:hypothetical protein [Ruminococcus sp.]
MAKEKMKTVRIIALREDRKRLLEHLQDSGLVQVRKTESGKKGFKKIDKSSQMQVFERNVQLTEHALKILDNIVPEKSGLLDSFKGRREVDPDEIGVIASKSGEVIAACNKLVELDKLITDNSAEQVKIRSKLDMLDSWKNLDIPLNTTGTKSTAVFIGSLPEEYSEQKIKERLAEENPKLECELEIIHAGHGLTNFVMFVPISQKVMAEDCLRSLGYSRPMSPTSKIPKVKTEQLTAKSERLKEQSEQAEKEIASFAPMREDIKTTQDYFRIRSDKYSVINGLD